MSDDDLVKMARLAQRDERMSTGALYGALADRIEELEAKLVKAVDVIEWVLIAWDDHHKHGYNMQGDWEPDARTALAELTGGNDE